MGLRVFLGKDNFYKSGESNFFYHFAHILKYMFKEHGYDGLLLGAPFTKDQSERYLQADAILFAKNAIIIVDFKSHGGVITTPITDNLTIYRSKPWHTNQPGRDNGIIKGGSHANPFDQVQNYKDTIRHDILFDIPGSKKWYINTGIIFYGDNLDVSKAHIPQKIYDNFFIATNDFDTEDPFNTANFYYYKIKAVLSSKGKEDKRVRLTDADLTKIRERFVVHEELTDDFIDKMTGVSQAKLKEKDDKIEAMHEIIFKQTIEIKDKNKTIKQQGQELEKIKHESANKDKIIADKDDTNKLLAGKNLKIIKENQKKDSELAQKSHELIKSQNENAKLKTENRKHEIARRELQQTIEEQAEELKKHQDLPPEITNKLEQMHNDVKALKIRDYNKEINDNWKEKFADLKQELTEIKIATDNMTNPKPKWIILAISSLLLVAISLLIAIPINLVTQTNNESVVQVSRPDSLEGPYIVNYVRDGDTIYIDYNGKSTGVRLIGIEAPESEDSAKDGSRCFNKQAKAYLSNKIDNNQVYLEYDESQGEIDYYGRLIRYVWIDDELLNLSLIANGYAKEFTFNNEYKYKDAFNQAQANAKRNGLGLWTTCAE